MNAPALRDRLLFVVGAGGLLGGGFALGRATAPRVVSVAAAGPEASAAYVKMKAGTYTPPPPSHNACYAAGLRTAPLPCLDRADAQLPMLIGQCNHPATNITEGPSTAQYAGSPAVICCYHADMPTCAGRPLLVDRAPRRASLRVGASAWGGAVGRGGVQVPQNRRLAG
jgi:hypothetical protein